MRYKLVGVGPDGPIMVRNYQAPHANEGTPQRKVRGTKARALRLKRIKQLREAHK